MLGLGFYVTHSYERASQINGTVKFKDFKKVFFHLSINNVVKGN